MAQSAPPTNGAPTGFGNVVMPAQAQPQQGAPPAQAPARVNPNAQYTQGPRVPRPVRAPGYGILNFHPQRGQPGANGVWVRPVFDPNGGDYGFFGRTLQNTEEEYPGLSFAEVARVGLTGDYVMAQLTTVGADGVLGISRLTGDGANGSIAIPAPAGLNQKYAWIGLSFEAIGAIFNAKSRSRDGMAYPRLGSNEVRVASVRAQLRAGQLGQGQGFGQQPAAPAQQQPVQGPFVAPTAQPIVQPQAQPQPAVQTGAQQIDQELGDENEIDLSDDNPLAL